MGLFLDSAIINLSDQVFATGMAYVALSRVQSLSGLHLVALDRKVFSISVPSLKEVNRLRETFRKDLKLYSIPQRPVDRKCKPTGCVQQYDPKTKKPRLAMAGKRKAGYDSAGQPLAKKPALQQPVPGKRKLAFDSAGHPPAKKPALEEPGKRPGSHDGSRRPANPTQFRYNSVDVRWQWNACATLGLHFEKPNGVTQGGPDVVLNPPSAANCKAISGDGNCLFHTFSHIICGSEDQHMAVHLAILNHMASERVAPLLLRGHLHGCASIAEHTTAKNMDRYGFWGTEVEMLALAHLLHTTVYLYVCQLGKWHQYGPTSVEAHCMCFQSPCTSDIL